MADEARDEEPFDAGRFDVKADGEFLLQDYPEAVLVLNEEGNIRYGNRAADALLTGEVKDRLEAHLRSGTEGPDVDQVRVALDDGGERVLQIKRAATGWRGEAAEIVAVHDVTRHIDAVQEIKAANCRYVAVLDGLPVANYLVMLDEAATALFVSPRFEELLGYPRDAWSGEKTLWRRFIHEDERDRVIKDFERCIENEKRFSAEYRVVTQSGDLVWVREETRCVEAADGKQPFLVGILTDISKDKKSEEELSNYRDFLEQQAIVRAEELDKATARLQEETSSRETLEKETSALREELERAGAGREPEAESRPGEAEARARVEELERANEALDNELRETRGRLEAIEARGAEAPAQTGVETLHQTIDELREEIAEARRIEVEVRAGRDHVAAQAKARIEKLEKQIEALRAERDEFQRTAVELKAGREHAEELAREHLDEFRNATMALREELEKARPRVAELEGACEELTGRSETQAEEIKNLRAELERESARREEAEGRIAEIQKQLDETRWYEGELKGRYKELEGELQAREEELRGLCERLENEVLLHGEAHARVVQLQKQLDETRWYESELRARVKELEGELQEARRLADEARAAEKAAVEGGALEIKKVMEQYEQATAERQRAEQALEAGVAQVEAFRRQFKAGLQPTGTPPQSEEGERKGDGWN